MTAKRQDIFDLPDWPGLMSREQAAAYCALSASAFDKHIRPHIQAHYFGKSVRFPRTNIDKFIDMTQGDGVGSNPSQALDALNG